MKKQKQFVGHKWWKVVKPKKKHRKISNHALSSKDLIMQIENLVYSITKLKIKVPKYPDSPTSKKTVMKRKYSFRIFRLHYIPRKYLTGIHGRLVSCARKEGLLNSL